MCFRKESVVVVVMGGGDKPVASSIIAVEPSAVTYTS